MGAAGSTPIHKAAKEGNIVDLRVAVQQYGSRIDDQEKSLGYTGLHIAAWQGYDAIIRELLQRGANPNLLDHEGRTPLHLAAQKGHAEVVRSLLRHNGTVRDVRDKLNHTAWDYCQAKYPQVAQMIGPPVVPTVQPVQQASASATAPAMSGVSISTAAPSTQASRPTDYLDRPQRPTAPSIYPSLPGAHPDAAISTATQSPMSPYSAPATPSQPQPQYPSITAAYQQQQQQQSQPQSQPQQQVLPPLSQAPLTHPAPTPVAQATANPYSPLYPTYGGQQHIDSSGLAVTGEEPSAPPAGPSVVIAEHSQEHLGAGQRPRRNPLQSAAALAMQQLAKLGIQPPPPGQIKPIQMLGGLAAAGIAHLTGNHQKQSEQPAEAQHHLNPAVSEGLQSGSASGSATPWSQSSCRMYRYEDLAAATENFAAHNKIGQGGFGEVFRGMLDGVPVAIKVMDVSPEAMQGVKELTAEINILSRLHHPHVVLLIGACPERGMLVYDLAEGGSLEDRLFRPTANRPPLSWQDRVRIALEAASALLYLHTATPSIVHMDIKPANILLDRTLRAKLGDVGLARLMGGPLPSLPPGQGYASQQPQPSTTHDSQLVGTLAYVDPEYLRTGQFSPKSDVYALGMVMLQMLTGQDNRLVTNVVEEARNNVLQFAYVLDQKAGAWPAAEAMAFADVALRCTQVRRQDRPDLRTEVLPALLQLKRRTELYDSPLPATATHITSPTGTTALPSGEVPAMFLCPITQEVMHDPVVAADGYTYEREAIATWFTRSATSPLTNLPLSNLELLPNNLVRSAIKDWLEQQPHK